MNKSINHIASLVVIISMALQSFGQVGTSCTSPFSYDGTTPFSVSTSINIPSGGEYWYEFKIDASTAARYAGITLTNNATQSKFQYEIYGPYDNSYNCGSLGSALSTGNSVVETNPIVASGCITYDETTNSPAISFQMNSSTNTRYYLVKIVLVAGEFSSLQNIDVSASPITATPTTVQNTYCPNYTDGVVSPCATNDVCSTPITICTDFHQDHSCGNCGFEGEHTRFYVLKILNPNTTVNMTVSTFLSNSSAVFSVSNQMVYGPCDPALMQSSNLLYSFSGQTTSYTFVNTGNYLVNVAMNQIECPRVEFDFVDIDANCQPIPTPPTVDFMSICTGGSLSNIVNLVYNGDFEVGNFPESTTQISSDDIYQATFITNPGEGRYSIVQEPFVVNGVTFNNHTPNVGGNGYFMFAHDKKIMTADEYVWKKVVNNVLPNTDYTYEAWFTPAVMDMPNNTDNLNLYINGQLVASKNRATVTPGVWEKIDFVWNSGNVTSADLRIEIENNNGVDDGRIFIDDVSFTMVEPEMECCNNEEILFNISITGNPAGATYTWDFGDGSPTSNVNTHSYANPGTYTVTLTASFTNSPTQVITHNITIIDCDYICETCIGSFAPIPGQKYVISAWAKEVGAPATKTNYDNPEIKIAFTDGNNTVLGPFKPSGEIIDGWQRIEVEFIIPSTAQDMEILLESLAGEVLYDDIRVFPFNANMKSFVYDPINMRLMAELDERHYATYYEYDESGQLIRVKKETERGIKTIQENRSNTSKNE